VMMDKTVPGGDHRDNQKGNSSWGTYKNREREKSKRECRTERNQKNVPISHARGGTRTEGSGTTCIKGKGEGKKDSWEGGGENVQT